MFTDIEGSTRLLQELGEGYRAVQDEHDEIMRTAISDEGGIVVRTEGDSFFAVFPTPAQAVRAAVTAQRAIHGHDWPDGVELRVRMGIHTGEGTLGGDDYLGIDVNRAARIGAAGHGGQLLVSGPARALIEHSLPEGIELRDLGSHRLKDLAHPERIYQVVIAGLPQEFPALRSMDARPNNLPLQLTSLVGRTDEIAATIDMLERHRLVTLTGPGGTGKTRQAVEVAGRLLHRFDDGVYLVELAAVSDPAQVPSAVAQALGIIEGPGRSLADVLTDWLADKEVLLVLDNFEHLLEAAPVVERLLGSAPGVKLLVTSRAPLRLYGEHELPVPPLRLAAPMRSARRVAVGGGGFVRGASPGDQTGARPERRHHRRHRPSLRPARRPATRHRAGGETGEHPLAARHPGSALHRAGHAGCFGRKPAGTATDPACHDRVELRPTG